MSFGPICNAKLVVGAKGVYGLLDPRLVIPCVKYENHEGNHAGQLEYQGGAFIIRPEYPTTEVPRTGIEWMDKPK